VTSEFVLQRHQKLWEEQNLFIRRLVAGILVIGLLILLKVLIPFVRDTKGSITFKEELTAISREMAPLEQRKAQLQELNVAMSDVRNTLRRAPWMQERNELIRNLARIKRESPEGGTPEEYQQAADRAIGEIFKQVDAKIIRPLEKALPAGQESSALAVGIVNLRSDMEQWKNEQTGKVWYRTIHEKDEKIRQLDSSLRENFGSITPLLRDEQSRIKTNLGELRNKMADLNEDIEQGVEHLQQLEKDMEQILPAWISGLIDVKQMIQLFPLLFLISVIYIVLIALRLSVHYRIIVRELSLSPQDIQDFSASSIWTLFNRGFLGTILTMGLYFAIIGIYWLLFEQGVDLLMVWLETEPEGAWFSRGADITTLLWTGRSIYIALVGYIFFHLYWNGNDLGH
jgi:hypothetical protein